MKYFYSDVVSLSVSGLHHDLGIRNHLLTANQMDSSFSIKKKEHARLNSPYPGWAPLPHEIASLPSCQPDSSFSPSSWPLYFDVNFGGKKKITLFVLGKSRLSATIEITKFSLSYRMSVNNGWQLYTDYPFIDTRVSKNE